MNGNQRLLRQIIGGFLIALGIFSMILSSFLGGTAALAEDFPTASDPTPARSTGFRPDLPKPVTRDPFDSSLLPPSLDRDKVRAAFEMLQAKKRGEDPDELYGNGITYAMCVTFKQAWVACVADNNNSPPCMEMCEQYQSRCN